MPACVGWRDIGRSAESSRPEVQELDEVLVVAPPDEEDVLGLEIAMDDPDLVGRGQGRGDLLADHQRASQRVGSVALAGLVEVGPLEQLHHQIREPGGRAHEVEDLDDVLVVDAVDGTGLVEEAAHDVGVVRELGQQKLDGHPAADRVVLGQEDGAHPAAAELLGQSIRANRIALAREAAGRGMIVHSFVGGADHRVAGLFEWSAAAIGIARFDESLRELSRLGQNLTATELGCKPAPAPIFRAAATSDARRNRRAALPREVRSTMASPESSSAAPVLPEWKPKHNPWAIALTVTMATFMEVLDTSIANVSLPNIARQLLSATQEL